MMKVLVAEDEPISSRILVNHLQKWGYEVCPTRNGREALEAVKSQSDISLVILDWMMPQVNGIEVCHEIKKLPNSKFMYVIMLTSRGEVNDLAKAFESGADDYVVKPINSIELRARVRAGERIIQLKQTLSDKINALEDALANVKKLQGILPICAWCKRVRDDEDYWRNVEDYIKSHSLAEVSHGICPDCLDKYFGDKSLEELNDPSQAPNNDPLT